MDCSRDARLMFIGVWTFCDDRGVHPENAKRLKAEIFPGDDISVAKIAALVEELVVANLLGRLEKDGEIYLFVTGWPKHQRIDRPNYRYPPPPWWDARRACGEDSSNDRRTRNDYSSNALRSPDEQSPTERSGEEKETEKEKEEIRIDREQSLPPRGGESRARANGAPRRPAVDEGKAIKVVKGRRLPAAWFPNIEDRAYASKLGFTDVAIISIGESFRDYWHAKAGQDACKVDWSATWRTWCRREAERPRPAGPQQFDTSKI